jgi:hypothetical protein
MGRILPRQCESQTSQVLLKTTDEFYPRIIVIDGQIQSVSTIVHSHFIVNRLWIPSSIKLNLSENVNSNENEKIQSDVIENQSKLAGIEMKASKRADLQCIADHFPRLHLKTNRDCDELKSGHSLHLVSLKSFFLRWLNSWVMSASISAHQSLGSI